MDVGCGGLLFSFWWLYPAAFLTQTVNLDDGVTVKFEIWDTAGQGMCVQLLILAL